MNLRRANFKLLVDQITSQVVWLTDNVAESYPPIIDPSLTPIHFRLFTDLTDLEIWNGFIGYKLFCKDDFSIKDALDDICVRLLRCKATAAEIINSSIDFRYQSLGYADSRMYEQIRSFGSDWTSFFQKEYNCDYQQASDLIKFKLEEYDNVVYNLESTRVSSMNKIIKASTVSEIQEVLDLTGIALLNNRVTILKELRSIRGY